jgi:hypothetical protein
MTERAETMVERVARAISAEVYQTDQNRDEAWRQRIARAAIEAMRPSEAMQQAVWTMSTDAYSHGQIFSAMIAAALSKTIAVGSDL